MCQVHARFWQIAGRYYTQTPRRCYHRAHNTPIFSTHKYQPLLAGEFRVLDLKPGNKDEPLRGTLRNVALTLKPHYDSLSYCWGVGPDHGTIHCGDGVINITKNLRSALQHLRDGTATQTLWIDALCINQTDLQERAAQVNIMKGIFHASRRTVVWLGEEKDDSPLAMALLRLLAKAAQERGSLSRSIHESVKLPPLYDRAWSALAALLQRPWWHRAWVVQEVSVTEDILVSCGNEILPWSDLEQAVQYAVNLGFFIAYGGSAMFQAFNLFQTRASFQDEKLPSLYSILLQNRSFLATDPRDKVFALLSLADRGDVEKMGITPNYRQSAEQLFTKISMALLERKDLDALKVGSTQDKLSGTNSLPSWVSDWSVSDPSVPLNSIDSINDGNDSPYLPTSVPIFSASKSTTPSPIFDRTRNLLGLCGIVIDEIESTGTLSRTRYLRHVSHMFELFVQCHDTLSQLKDWETTARIYPSTAYPTGHETRKVAYWKTLCAGRIPPNLTSVYSDSRYKYYILIRSLRRIVRFTIRWFPRSSHDTWYNRFFYGLFQSAWRVLGLTPAKVQRIGFPPESRLSNWRRMVRTKKEYIGLAPRHAQVGDCVVIVKGGKVPLVVRRDGRDWVFVGEAYVHGVMEGQAWDEKKCVEMWFK